MQKGGPRNDHDDSNPCIPCQWTDCDGSFCPYAPVIGKFHALFLLPCVLCAAPAVCIQTDGAFFVPFSKKAYNGQL